MTEISDKRENAENQAVEWFILLEEYPGDAGLKQKIQDWCDEDPLHLAAWQDCAQTNFILQQAGDIEGRATEKGIQPDMGATLSSKTPPGVYRGLKGFAAATLLVFGITFFQPFNIWLQADHQTTTAESREIDLEDGSVLYLGADSAVDLNYSADQRRIKLLAGEAYFDVAPDKNRPFIVTAGETETRALGTAFNISLYDETVYVGVRHGHVRLSHKSGKNELDLQIHDVGSMTEAGKGQKRTVDNSFIASWRKGKLLIDNHSLGSVIDQLDRYSENRIIILEAPLKNQRITGVYDLSDPDSSIAAIARSNGIQVRTAMGTTLLSSF